MDVRLSPFREVWAVDFEFGAPDGERPDVRCMVALELRTGRLQRLWGDTLTCLRAPTFPIGSDTLVVAYYASAELGCFLQLGWKLPARILDLFCEFRNLTNGLGTVCGNGLLGALAHFGLDGMDATEKIEMRDLALRGGRYTRDEQIALYDYCESDVRALARLLPSMLPSIDLPRALLRGRYMAAVANMEHTGTPIDVESLAKIKTHWPRIKDRLIEAVDADYGVFVPTNRDKLAPATAFGTAIFDAAAKHGLDAETLATTATEIWRRERSWEDEHADAICTARKATKLTPAKIERFEAGGTRDYSQFPGLDSTVRELAGKLPALGIGAGYVAGEVYDRTDYSGDLWELLRQPERRKRQRHDATIVREAVQAVLDGKAEPPSGPWTFSTERFARWLVGNNIPWPRLTSGALALDDDTFKSMAKQYPAVAPLRELRHTLGELRLFDLTVGHDGRNRCLLSPFRSITGRNQPSNARFIFGPSCWLRGLIRPDNGRAVAYVDWSQQEFGIAAALSHDSAMSEAYASGDPYLAFAKQARAVPVDATKKTHAAERERFKVCALAVQYGMAEQSLAVALGQTESHARELLQLHRKTYPTFWRWSQQAVDHAMLWGWLRTVFGWRVRVGTQANPRSLANFPMQANGAEMLRLACCLATEGSIDVCAPVHDALLVEGPAESIEATVAATQEAMVEASRQVLDGFELRSDAKIIRHPDRYMDPRGERLWGIVAGIIDELESSNDCTDF